MAYVSLQLAMLGMRYAIQDVDTMINESIVVTVKAWGFQLCAAMASALSSASSASLAGSLALASGAALRTHYRAVAW